MEMIKSRNQTSHTYRQKVADEIAGHIVERYFPLFQHFLHKMSKLQS